MDYEELLKIADLNKLTVKEKPLQSADGRIRGNRIAIRKDIETCAEKACVLAEEIGHAATTYGRIIEQDTVLDRRQELRARAYGYDLMVGLDGLISAFEAGCQNRHDIAEHLGVTGEYLQNCIDHYKQRYGEYAVFKDYVIVFYPDLAIIKTPAITADTANNETQERRESRKGMHRRLD